MPPSNLLRTSIALLLALTASTQANAQASMRPCAPVAQRTDDPGPACFTAKESLGALTAGEYFWHLYTFPDVATADAAKLPHSTVVESLGKVWLFAVAPTNWKPKEGTYVAKLGPLTTKSGVDYEAVYMQSIFTPGMTAPLHTHSGMEAFYTLTGDTCLETSEGVQNARGPGNTVLVDGGLPMLLMATGTEKRRGIVLILHDTMQPPTTLIADWKSKGLCRQ
jgi:quercetin dioxygenase-like cupin family protein